MRYSHTVPESGSFEVLPVGKYSAVIDDIEKKVGPKSEYLSVVFRITEPGYESRKVWYNAVFGMSFMDVLLTALGYALPPAGGRIVFDTDDENFRHSVILTIGHKVHEGRTREFVENIEPNPRTGDVPQDDGKDEKFEIPF